MTLPNFLMCGAGKSGTTTLWNVVRRHPDVFMPVPKEQAFFTSAEYDRSTYHRGIEWYESLFATAGDRKAIGEASGAYLFDPASPALIRRHVPAARLIFVFRDPVERMYSHYWQERKRGRPLPPFDDVVTRRVPPFERLMRTSRYATNLARHLAVFPRQQMLCLRYEELRDDPRGLLGRVCGFLDIDVGRLGDVGGRRYNPAGRPRSDTLERVLRSRRMLTAARALAPQWVLPVGRRLLARTKALNRTTVAPPAMSREVRIRLLGELREEIERLESLLGWDLGPWKQIEQGGR